VNIKLAYAITVLTAFASTPILAQQQPQQQPNIPKASKADVQKVVSAIKADNAKMAAFCQSWKLDAQSNAIAEKNPNDPKLESLGKQIDDANKKVGPEFERIIYAQLDESSGALLDDLAKSCK
jgi:hypothetical protein